jgi:hypothetical protein
VERIDHDACCSEEANGPSAKSGLDNKIIIPNIFAYYIFEKVCDPPIYFQRRARHDVNYVVVFQYFPGTRRATDTVAPKDAAVDPAIHNAFFSATM